MKPSNIRAMRETLGSILGSLHSQPGVSAYPQISPLIYTIGAAFDSVVEGFLAADIDETVHGETPAARLYEKLTGIKVGIPREHGMVYSTSRNASSQSSYPHPLSDIIEYSRQRSSPPEKYSFRVTGQNSLVSLITLDDRHRAEVSFTDNLVTVEIPNIHTNQALVHCDLFDEPYEVTLSAQWLDRYVRDYVYDVLVPEDERITVLDPKRLFADMYFADNQPIDPTHPVHELTRLLESGHRLGYRVTVPISDTYLVEFAQTALQPWLDSSCLVVSNVYKQDIKGKRSVAYNWHKNPLLVKDLLTRADELIALALSQCNETIKDRK